MKKGLIILALVLLFGFGYTYADAQRIIRIQGYPVPSSSPQPQPCTYDSVAHLRQLDATQKEYSIDQSKPLEVNQNSGFYTKTILTENGTKRSAQAPDSSIRYFGDGTNAPGTHYEGTRLNQYGDLRRWFWGDTWHNLEGEYAYVELVYPTDAYTLVGYECFDHGSEKACMPGDGDIAGRTGSIYAHGTDPSIEFAYTCGARIDYYYYFSPRK